MRYKVLIVDDELENRELVEDALTPIHEHLEILMAEDGEEALEIIVEERPNLVFLDVMMPKMDGFQVCETVKRQMRLNDVYIAILTAKTQSYNVEKGEFIGADIYLTKPVMPSELLKLTREVLNLP